MVTTHLFLKCDEFMNDKTYNIKKKKKLLSIWTWLVCKGGGNTRIRKAKYKFSQNKV